jgi:hypothetical protein
MVLRGTKGRVQSHTSGYDALISRAAPSLTYEVVIKVARCITEQNTGLESLAHVVYSKGNKGPQFKYRFPPDTLEGATSRRPPELPTLRHLPTGKQHIASTESSSHSLVLRSLVVVSPQYSAGTHLRRCTHSPDWGQQSSTNTGDKRNTPPALCTRTATTKVHISIPSLIEFTLYKANTYHTVHSWTPDGEEATRNACHYRLTKKRPAAGKEAHLPSSEYIFNIRPGRASKKAAANQQGIQLRLSLRSCQCVGGMSALWFWR